MACLIYLACLRQVLLGLYKFPEGAPTNPFRFVPQGAPYGVTASIFPLVSFEEHYFSDGALPAEGSRWATGGRFHAALAATLSPAASAHTANAVAAAASAPPFTLPCTASASANGGTLVIGEGFSIDAAWAGEAQAQAELASCGLSTVQANILGDKVIAVYVKTPLTRILYADKPSEAPAVRYAHYEPSSSLW